MKRIVAWFVDNGVAANLLMVTILAIGLLTVGRIKQEVFPEFESGFISVTIPYPGAAPEEVEEGVVVRVEEAVQDLEGIERLRSTSTDNAGVVSIEVTEGFDGRKLLSDIQARVDALDTLPDEAEEPVVEEVLFRRQVIEVAVAGRTDERTLKELAERLRDDLTSRPDISQAQVAVARPYEVSIEVSEADLQRHGLTFDRVAAAVRSSSLDLPGGAIESEDGEILLRAEGQAYRGEEFERLPVVTRADGSRVLLGDVARVVDGFAPAEVFARFNGEPAVLIQVFRVGDQNAIDVSAAVEEELARFRADLPEGIEVATYLDETAVLKSRLELLQRNGIAGLVLVLVVLALFLKLRLAGWVALGIPISFLGAVAMMPGLDLSVNLLTLFAFIVVLGIVVDDAIIVGENIYTKYQAGGEGRTAAIDGATEVAKPVIFAVLTTVAAFAPLLAVGGLFGKFMRGVPLIVLPTLAFSLVESLLILPNHLSHLRQDQRGQAAEGLRGSWTRLQRRFAAGLERFVERVYHPLVERAVAWRYLTLAIGLAALIVTASIVGAGWLRFNFLPPVEADNVAVDLTMPQGTPSTVTSREVARIERAALELADALEAEHGVPIVRHVVASVGDQPYRLAQSQRGGNAVQSLQAEHRGEVFLELFPAEERPVTSGEVADLWRQRVGTIVDAVELVYSSSLLSTGDAIHVDLYGSEIDDLRSAAAAVKEELATYAGVRDVADSFRSGKRELELTITPEAEAVGLTLGDVARQVRQAFYGEEAQRVQRGRDDVKVMVRFPAENRRSLTDLESMRIRAPGGIEMPLSAAATWKLSRGPASIQRTDRHRVVSVTADVDLAQGNPNQILADLTSGLLPELSRATGVRWSLEGQQEQQRETLAGLGRGFAIALLAIYALLAIPFRSYTQPLVVMSAIPFGLVGAVVGHLLMGIDLAILSMFGIVALTGVVINDSLVLVDVVNREREGGRDLAPALREAGKARFRPILLTSLTTFAGLTPLLLEKSVQAQFLIPMAVSLGFGVLFATGITLLLVPALYAVQEDATRTAARLLGLSRSEAAAEPAAAE